MALGLKRPVQMLVDPHRSIPIVWGLWKTRLQLPAEAVHWNEEQLQSVLLHELAHVRRRDLFVLALTQLACALHWFNPLVWIVAWRLHVERERACDDLVLASGVRASAYAEHLLNVATRLTSSGWTQACGLAMARNSSLHGRLTAVLNEKRNRRSVTNTLVAASLLLGAGIAIPIAMLHAADEETSNVESTVTDATEEPTTVGASTNKGPAMILDPGIEQHLDWSEPVNGLRGAVRIRAGEAEGHLGKERRISIVLQNVSDGPIPFCDTAMTGGDVFKEGIDKRTLYIEQNKETLSAMSSAESTQTDVTLQPRETVELVLFKDEPPEQSPRIGDSIAEGIVKYPNQAIFATLNLMQAPAGAWTGKLTTPPTRGAFAAEGPMPSHEKGKELFRHFVDRARLTGDIPGGLISRLHDKVKYFIEINTGDKSGDPHAKKLQPLLARLEKPGDWKQADVVSLMDDIAAVSTIPLNTTLEQVRERTLQRGQPLPKSLQASPWGESLPGGLRMAWRLEPAGDKHHLGSSLKSRLLIHNSGEEPVAFVTRSFHQPEHKARTADGAGVKIESTFWTTRGRPEPYRLHPGEFCEVHAPGIGIGLQNEDVEDWANIRAGSTIFANEGDDVVFQPGAVILSGDHNEKVEADWWLQFIKERANREAPVPADANERMTILFRVVNDLFGGTPTPEDATAFLSDTSREALDNLALRLSERSWLTSVAGPIQSGETKIHVLPEDPDAATRTRVVQSAGYYNLAEQVRLTVTQRTFVTYREFNVSEATITYFPPGKANVTRAVELPEGENTWAAASSPETTVLWIQQLDGVRKIDFTDPANIKEEVADASTMPAVIRDALPKLTAPAAPNARPAGPPPAAAAPPATEANAAEEKQVPPLDGNATNGGKANVTVGAAQPESTAVVASKPFMPVPEIDQMLLSYWQARARTDGKIPGALVASLAKPVEQYAENYPRLKTLVSRFDASHDWLQADVVALLDEILQIAPEGLPLVARFNQYHFSQPAIVRLGQPLPNDLPNVAWGIPLENGLRSAWLIAPDSKEHALGSVLTTRLLIHNAGKEAVVFVLPTHHNPGNAKAGSIQISEIPFTRLFSYAKFRLEPGHQLEVSGFNIAVGDKYDKQSIVEAVIQAKAGDEVPLSYTVVATDGVLPYPDSNKDPVAEFQRAIAERVAEEAPMPSSAADRQQLIRRVIRDMFGDTATSEEISSFVADNAADALVRLTARLQDRKTAQSFVGEIPSGETRFRVVAAESANAGVQNPPQQQPLAPPAAINDDSASVKEPSESPISKMIRGRLLLPDKTPAVGYLVFADDGIDRYRSSRRTPDIPLPDLPQPSKTNENGEFEITLGENRSPGVYYLWVGINNFQVSGDYAPLEVPVPENGHMGDIQFSTGRRITGRVTGLDGKGLANVYVMSRRQNARRETWSVMRNSRSATTGEDGSFILPRHAAGTFLLHISTTKLGKDELDLAFANQIVEVEDTTPWAVNFRQLLTANSGNQLNLSPSPKLPIPDTDPLSISIEIRPLETVDITLDVVVDREDPAFGDFEVRISGHLPGMNANDPRSYWTRNNTTKLTTGKFAIAVPRGLTMCNLYAQPIYMRKNDNPVFIWKRPAREVREVASRLKLDTISETVDLALGVQDAVSLSINAEGANEIPGRDVSFEGHAVSPTLGVISFRMFSRDAVDDELFTMQVPECTTARITMMAKGFAPVTEKIANIEPNGRNTIWTYLKPNGLRLTE